MEVLPFPSSPAGDWVEPSRNLQDLLILHPAITFFVRVKGDALVGAGIHDGDLVVQDRFGRLGS